VLKKQNALKVLNLNGNLLGDEGFRYLADGLEKKQALHTLGVGFTRSWEQACKYLLNALKNNTALCSLDFSGHSFGNALCSTMSEMLAESKCLETLVSSS
jgi:Ran GTPase-activating protein (RanGAP) involved in mRNA processing and transport